jgi:tetratricopeptide (TPR) repeat protein
MQAGAAAEKQQKWADAVQAYREALKAQPNDVKATQALRSAEYWLHMTEGKKLLAAKRFGEAVTQFEAALKMVPDSAEAKTLLKQARDGKP